MVKACILLIEGTNCEDETRRALEGVGIEAELVHLKQLTGNASKDRQRNLLDYQILMFPGGWSSGDYVRAGAIFAARIKSSLMPQLGEFIENDNLVCGICNGFQILTELGILPGFDGISQHPQAALTTNKPAKFQCRPTYLRHENRCKVTDKIDEGKVLQIPVAHVEGRFTFGENNDEFLQKLIDNKQIVFRYCRENGEDAGEFPWNPNGSLHDIAGISNPEGNVLGMMPHPERVIDGIQDADWTRANKDSGDGRILFESIKEYSKRI